MGDDGFRLLDFSNAVTDLIKGEGPSDAKVNQLRDRTGVPQLTAEDTPDLIHKVVSKAFRDTALRERLLEQIPLLFPSVEESLEQLKASYASSGSPGFATDIIVPVRAAGALRGKFRDVLVGEAHLDPQDISDLRDQLLGALNQISNSLELLIGKPADTPAKVRRLTSMLTRIEGEIESCLDALVYFGQVNDSVEDARKASSRVGITEADRATAELVRLRELNYCREQIRYRLARLSEDCNRVITEFP
jgi:hypothetical protein